VRRLFPKLTWSILDFFCPITLLQLLGLRHLRSTALSAWHCFSRMPLPTWLPTWLSECCFLSQTTAAAAPLSTNPLPLSRRLPLPALRGLVRGLRTGDALAAGQAAVEQGAAAAAGGAARQPAAGGGARGRRGGARGAWELGEWPRGGGSQDESTLRSTPTPT
jgi:hypothetical protein